MQSCTKKANIMYIGQSLTSRLSYWFTYYLFTYAYTLILFTLFPLFGTDPDQNRATWETPSSEAIPCRRKPLRRTRLLRNPAQTQVWTQPLFRKARDRGIN